ncbi:MAG: hypothetical protein HOC82_00655, partial [Bacteroidetes bacterium]|nr:hypothetical protein [Bacteroidota bacterium]
LLHFPLTTNRLLPFLKSLVFLFGVFSKKGTYMGAMVTLILGLALGITAFCFDFEPISGYMYLTHGWHMPFMMQAWWLFVICSIIYFLVSWFTKKPSSEVIEKYTWKNPLAVVLSGKINKWTDPRVLALMLVVVLITLYIIF